MPSPTRRQFMVALGGIFAATVLPKRPLWKTVPDDRFPVFYGEFTKPADYPVFHDLQPMKVLEVSIVSGPTNCRCTLQGSATPDGPWEPIEMFPPPRYVRAAYVDGEPLAISYRMDGEVLEAGGQDEEEEDEESSYVGSFEEEDHYELEEELPTRDT